MQRILLGGWIGKYKEGLRLRLVQRQFWQTLKFPPHLNAFNAQENSPCLFIFPCLPAFSQPWASQKWNREDKQASRRVMCSTWVQIKRIPMVGNTISTLDLQWMRIVL